MAVTFGGGLILCVVFVLVVFSVWIEDRDQCEREKASVLPFGILATCCIYGCLILGFVDWVSLTFFSLMVSMCAATLPRLIRFMN